MLSRPVLFIHGFDGKPQDWHSDGFPQFLAEAGGFDPDLLRVFSYGYTRTLEDGRTEYDNEGDMRRIAGAGAAADSQIPNNAHSNTTLGRTRRTEAIREPSFKLCANCAVNPR